MKSFIVIVVACTVAAGFTVLGKWQLHRSAEHEAENRRYADAAVLPPLGSLAGVDPHGEARYRRVALRGSYWPTMQVVLDNMTHEGAAGYQILTLLIPDDGSAAVAVNRGWVPAGPDRSHLPDVRVDGEPRAVQGRLAPLPVPMVRLGSAPIEVLGAVQRMSFPDRAELELAYGQALVAAQVLLDPDEPDGYVRQWGPPADRAARSLAYAGQWFAFAAVTIVGTLFATLPGMWRRRKDASG
jgi:surfeit locus 1 family protein